MRKFLNAFFISIQSLQFSMDRFIAIAGSQEPSNSSSTTIQPDTMEESQTASILEPEVILQTVAIQPREHALKVDPWRFVKTFTPSYA